MSALPDHRRILHGRTYSRSWNPCDFNPIERHLSPVTERIYGVLLATLMGVFLAAALVHYWST